MTGGVFDANNAGTVQNNVTLTSCGYSVDPVTGRIDLKLCGAGTSEFAVYQTAQNSALMVELDATAISSGIAYQQQSPSTPLPPEISRFPNGTRNLPQRAQLLSAGCRRAAGRFNGSFTSGNLDINTFNQPFSSDPVNTGTTTTHNDHHGPSSFTAPAANGRGTAVITGTNPIVTYNLVYY